MSKNTISNRTFSFRSQSGSEESLKIGRSILVAVHLNKSFSLLERCQRLASLPQDFYKPIFFLKVLFHDSFIFFSNQNLFVSFSILLIISGISILIGFQTRLSTFVFFFLQFFLVGFSYSFGDYHHPQALPILIGFLLCLTSEQAKNIQSSVSKNAWFFQFIKYFLGIIYLNSGLSKLMHSGADWLSGSSLAYYIQQDAVANLKPWGVWASQQIPLCKLLSWATLVFQCSFLIGIFRPRLQTVYVLAGIAFHFLTSLFMKADFPGFIAVLCFLLPWEKCRPWLLKFRRCLLVNNMQ